MLFFREFVQYHSLPSPAPPLEELSLSYDTYSELPVSAAVLQSMILLVQS